MKKRKMKTWLLAGVFLATLSIGCSTMVNTSATTTNFQQNSQVSEKSTININELFQLNGSATQINDNTVRLTQAEKSQVGAISGRVGLNLNEDFSLDMDVNLGSNPDGADGVGIVFHKGDIGDIGEYGGGLGILGLSGGIGFELDTYWDGKGDKDPSYDHYTMKGPHAGFVSTDENSILTALAPMQYISAPDDTFHNLKINWSASENLMTADYGDEHWEISPNVDKSERYTFEIAASTGNSYNEQTVRINSFAATFEKPELEANDISIASESNFDPLDSKIGLKATDKTDGDITDKIKVTKNDVDTSTSGTYHVTYEVTNSRNESTEKTITVTVTTPTWHDGSPNGWQDFSGQDLNLINDPSNALLGDYVFYSEQQASIYKIFEGEDALTPGKYRITVYAKGLPSVSAKLPLKVSLKKNSASADSRTILLANPLSSGTKVEKDYYKVSAEFTVAEDETTPLINVENFQGGYIAEIFLEPIE